VNISGLNGEIPVPVTFDGVTEWRKPCFMTYGKSKVVNIFPWVTFNRRSQWPRGLSQVLSSAARTLGLQVRILLGAWMCVCVSLCCVVLCRLRPWRWTDPPPKESYQMSRWIHKVKRRNPTL
jgi:hypothetical protein